jgi:hypothetical protein
MGVEHNYLAQRAAGLLLKQLRSESASWATVANFSAETVLGNSLVEWPRPDAAFVDRSLPVSLAIEFKPPGQSKREYLTGLGQALSYLGRYDFAALVLPQLAADGFAIGQYVRSLLERPFAQTLPIALFTYRDDPGDAADLTPALILRARPDAPVGVHQGAAGQMFWAYWRDVSQLDVFDVLRYADRAKLGTFDQGYREFWSRLLSKGKARTWEGKHRKAYKSSYDQHRLNTRMSLVHVGLIGSEGRLSAAGLQLLQLGKVYGADSLVFRRELALRVLEDGRHLELILWVEQVQRDLPPAAKSTSHAFNRALDAALQTQGVIEKVGSGGGKSSFLRDEQKLWNKLGLLQRDSGPRYFRPGEGLRFEWKAITSIVGK